MKDEVQLERQRCLAIVDAIALEAPAEAQRALLRLRNMIANGLPPQTFREQMEQVGEDLREAGGT